MKNKEQIDLEEQQFYNLQEKYLQTNDMKYIWDAYQIIYDAVMSSVKIKSKHNYISDIEGIVEDITLSIIERYKRHTYPEGGYQYFKALCDQASKSYYLPKYRETYSYEILEENTNKDFCIDEEGIIHPVSSFV